MIMKNPNRNCMEMTKVEMVVMLNCCGLNSIDL